METNGRRTRGFVPLELIHALRTEDRLDQDQQRIAEGLDPAAWIDQGVCLRLAAAAREQVCGGDWSRFHELGAGSVHPLLELGYRTVLRFGELEATFAALSVLWRATFSYGRAIADTDAWGVTVHVIDCPGLTELEGNLHAGWCLGVARLIGADCANMELRRRPWADEGNEQVVRLHWRGRTARRTTQYRSPIAKLNVRAVG